MDRRADLHCLGSAQKRFDRSLAIVHARRNRKVQLRQHGRTDRHHTQDVAQFRRLAVRRTLYESHPLDIHVRLEETVEKDYAPGPVTEQSARQGEDIGQAHGQFHRNGNLHRTGHPTDDLRIVQLQFASLGMNVRRLDENIKLQCGSSGIGHRRSVFDPIAFIDHAIDAGDYRKLRLRPRLLHQPEKSGLVILAQITLQINLRIAVSRIGYGVQRSRMVQDLLLEYGFEHYGTGTARSALLDALDIGGIGRTADNDRTRKIQPQVFCSHRFYGFLWFIFRKIRKIMILCKKLPNQFEIATLSG